MSTPLQESDVTSVGGLSVAVIGPNDQDRRGVAHALSSASINAVREFNAYPVRVSEMQRLLEQNFDVIIIDLDSDQKVALNLVEHVASQSQTTVMVYSAQTDPSTLVRCMRAGAREFLSQPISTSTLSEALSRAATRKPTGQGGKHDGGKVLLFLGGKGGSGVTTVACNFAVALAQGCGKNTLMIDLDLPLGDAALTLGITPQFSVVDALQNASRMDSNFLSKIVVKHSSGLSILAAPGKFPTVDVNSDAIERLVQTARSNFEYVVIDAGSRFDLSKTSLLDQADVVYLVMQAGIPELRNSHRVISEYFKTGGTNLEIVLNRFIPRSGGVDEEHIAKALNKPVQWKIPSDYVAVRRMQNEATPLTQEDSMISRAIQEMAGAASGVTIKAEKKKKGFSLFG
ncbi:MAG: AAA family ATPase [Acidobacteriota bacterium]|nr:AAA family ATPase [Acidobacteriota bacterium]